MKKYPEYKQLDLIAVRNNILTFWKNHKTFEKSLTDRADAKPFVFYEGPPSANGLPGIHHVMARTLKDMVCRYKTMQGYLVQRKAGWDTHGLPVELGVEKELGITKEDIGKTITVAAYNQACREAVMKYTHVWNKLTEDMGYWVDMDDPYITYKTKYIETVWWLLKQLAEKDLLYKGYTIQPYSPKAGTGLSSHELNQPGCYRDVTDTSCTAQFKVLDGLQATRLFGQGETYILAWTTTPWTLPSNTALTVGPEIVYELIQTFNPYTGLPIRVVLASALVGKYFDESNRETDALLAYQVGQKKLPWKSLTSFKGSDLVGLRYEQLLPYATPYRDADKAFRVIPGDFVTTEDGTGIVHTAPTFGADDARVATAAGVPPMLVYDANENLVPLVDLQGRFIEQAGPLLAGKYVKNEYYAAGEVPDKSVDVEICIHLKEANRAFKVEKYVHNYPHCWRTDKPILYYPLDSWFVRTTALKDRLIALNQSINWKPAATGTGRFGNWLENLNDWNLSRSRYWGIPLPIWRTEDGTEQKIIGSVSELHEALNQAVAAGVMNINPIADYVPGDLSDENYDLVDLHRPFVDDMVLVSESGKPMYRESDLIDVWFDSGSMPYAQIHYPFATGEKNIAATNMFPADFIAEGVDQTRGWFFTLHAISTLVFDQVAYKNVMSNGLVLDKNGQKMSKRLGNAVDPFKTMDDYGPDPLRWYMITNAQPWDNLKFDIAGVQETQRKFFGTLYNTYSFFALYANLDGFDFAEAEVPYADRPEIDRWILSELQSLLTRYQASMDAYEPTRAFRDVQDFVTEKLSNWYVRLCRRRFWKGEYGPDKISAYQTLYTCLEQVAMMAAPLAPFFAEQLYRDLNHATGRKPADSVHLAIFPIVQDGWIDRNLEFQMQTAQQLSSMVLSLRKREKIKVRQPLRKMMVPVKSKEERQSLEQVAVLISSEVNVKEIQWVMDDEGIFVKSLKPDFKALGPRYGRLMKPLTEAFAQVSQEEIRTLETTGELRMDVAGQEVLITREDAEILTKDIPGWLVMHEQGRTVALDVQLDDDLIAEGLSRELVNRIQNLRKDSGFEVTDRIEIHLKAHSLLQSVLVTYGDYLLQETLGDRIIWLDHIEGSPVIAFDGVETQLYLKRV
jgi:isoleucyl-tRNA synthetase